MPRLSRNVKSKLHIESPEKITKTLEKVLINVAINININNKTPFPPPKPSIRREIELKVDDFTDSDFVVDIVRVFFINISNLNL